MNFLKKLFGGKEPAITTNAEFWVWFTAKASQFYTVLTSKEQIPERFIEPVFNKLNELREGYFLLVGMEDEETAELVLTADGHIKNIVFVEELVAAAPSLPNWKFTALKPSLSLQDVAIHMGPLVFDQDNMKFYANELEQYPDFISLTFVHEQCDKDNREHLENGLHIYLDNLLGEEAFVSTVDEVKVVAPDEATAELVPLDKLKDFLHWRQKEFLEKYTGTFLNIAESNHSIYQVQQGDGSPLIATLNTDLLDWDAKASHPWILSLSLEFDSTHPEGLPDDVTMNRLTAVEEELLTLLRDADGYLMIGRETGAYQREIFFACKEFRKSSKITHAFIEAYPGKLQLDYRMYKDKYWRSFEFYRRV